MTLFSRLLAAGLVLGFLAFAGYTLVESGDAAGYVRATLEWERKEKAIEAKVEAKYAQKLAEAKQRQGDLQKDFDDLADIRLKEKSDGTKKLEAAVAAAVARTERLSIRTAPARCPVPGVATGGDPGAAGGPGGEARTDLLPETTAAIFSIAADSAAAVRDYNDVVRRYDLARIACNAK